MLIINADDLGRSRAATDNTLACHAVRRVTSTSAMVFMADSDRAAELALAAGIDVGLHLNLSESFTGHSIAPSLRQCHDRIRLFLRRSKYALLVFNPTLRREFRDAFTSQYAEFVRLYRRPPSHLDGHQHLHLASNILLQKILPAGTKVRRSFSFREGEKSLPNRVYRGAVDRHLAKRHRLTDYFFALSQNCSPERVAKIVSLAQKFNVELMAHPELPADQRFLLS
ncbi:MAG: ChbG/HpnK family deacetylase, partial [Opitutus sp.]